MMNTIRSHSNEGNSDLFLVDMPAMEDDRNSDIGDERLSQRLQAPPIPGTSTALEEENDNAAALAELEDIPMAAKKRKTINRGPKLDAKRLLSAKGLPAIPSYFENVKLKGKGHEAEDLSLIMSQLEHWAHRLYPKMTFDDCLEKIESLGHKKEVQTCLKKIRMGEPILDDRNQSTVITADGPTLEDADSGEELGQDDAEPSDVMRDIFTEVSGFAESSQSGSTSQAPPGDDVTSRPSTSADSLSGFHAAI